MAYDFTGSTRDTPLDLTFRNLFRNLPWNRNRFQQESPVASPSGDFGSSYDPTIADDPTLSRAEQELRDLFEQGEKSRQKSVHGALSSIFGTRRNLLDFLGGERERVLETFPEEFFSKERFESTKNLIFDQIQKDLQGGLQQAGINLASRGWAPGQGTIGVQGGGALRGAALNAQQQALNTLLSTREEANIAGAKAREDILGNITGLQSGAMERLGLTEAGIRAGDRYDPQVLMDIIGDVTSAQLGIDQSEQIMDMINKAIKESSSFATRFGESIPAILQAFIPSAERYQAGGLALSNMFFG